MILKNVRDNEKETVWTTMDNYLVSKKDKLLKNVVKLVNKRKF
jgi:hypothetical protein